MKTIILLVAAVFTLASAAAYAQMRSEPHSAPPSGQGQTAQGHGQTGPDHGQAGQGHGQTGQSGMMGQGGMQGGMHTMMHSMMQGMMHGAQAKGDDSPASLALQGVNAKMHRAMDITYTGNTDVDFMRGMIPHHQGAIDMAKTVLAFGKDAEVKKLAEAIIKAQEAEIAAINDWLKKNAK
jgi:uncharacterized protein (DUF305 family)